MLHEQGLGAKAIISSYHGVCMRSLSL